MILHQPLDESLIRSRDSVLTFDVGFDSTDEHAKNRSHGNQLSGSFGGL